MTRVKVILFPLLYLSAYILLVMKGHQLIWFYISYALLGLFLLLTVLNVVHDASHHSLFKNAKINRLAVYLLDLMGGNSYSWYKRHVHYHHSFPNIGGWDADLEKKIFFRLSQTDTLRQVHRFQHFYMPFLYLLFTFHWFVLRDFKDYFHPKSIVRRVTKVPPARYLELIIFKFFYFSYILVIPALMWSHDWFHYLLGFLLMHVLASMLAMMIILPNHWDENAVFRLPDSTLHMKESWALHQLTTTNDYATNQPILNFFLGGLNCHIAHHLFPNINHNYLPGITKEVRRITLEKNLPYKYFSFGGAIRSHYMLLKKNGYPLNIFEEE